MIGFKFGVTSNDVARTDELVKFKSAKHFSIVPVNLNWSYDLFHPNFVILFFLKTNEDLPRLIRLGFLSFQANIPTLLFMEPSDT